MVPGTSAPSLPGSNTDAIGKHLQLHRGTEMGQNGGNQVRISNALVLQSWAHGFKPWLLCLWGTGQSFTRKLCSDFIEISGTCMK